MSVDSMRGAPVSPASYYTLRRFYFDQLDARDRGRTQEWLDVFDDDATVTTRVVGGGSTVKKADFAPEIRDLDESFRTRGIQRRHCVSGFSFREGEDGTIVARFYGMFLLVDAERGARLQSAAMILDVLRAFRSTWRVTSRVIERDDLGRLPLGVPNLSPG